MIKVLQAGFYASVQDKGRIGFANIGVPISGTMDAYSADIANSVLNNSLECAVIEIAFSNCSFQFLSNTFICVSGADFSAKINCKKIKLNQKIKIFKNDILSFGEINFGARTYLAVSGGIQSEEIMQSKSMFKNITISSILKTGDILNIHKTKDIDENSNASIKINNSFFSSLEINCFKGPEFYLLSEKQQKQLINTTFSISNDINRMGYRLNEIIENNLSQIITSSVLAGTLQLTPSGKLIILMRDCQVTGGYPRILQLKEQAISKIAQKKAKQQIKFVLS